MRNVATMETTAAFKSYLGSIGVSLPFDEAARLGPDSPLAQPYRLGDGLIGNRFAVLPMEGWDSNPDGKPSEFTRRRWQRLGASGAKLVFGGEAVAVRQDGKGSPSQLMISEETVGEIADLREALVRSHVEQHGRSDDLIVGVQLTHSGRISKPHDMGRPEPIIVYHHPVLDRLFGVMADTHLLTDGEIGTLVEDFVKAAALSQRAGFDFVDVKHCHGYLGHEFLTAMDRPGRYGGSLDNRTRFLREVVEGIRRDVPEMDIGVRLSAVDFLPFQRGADGVGQPVPFEGMRYPYAFGGDGTGLGIDLTEPLMFLDVLKELDVRLVSISAGAGYNPHVLRPAPVASFDTYRSPEDPLVGVARLISVTAELKKQRPELVYVGAGYSYLQQWLLNVAQPALTSGMVDFVGLGRILLSYPEFVADVLRGYPPDRSRLCRACGDCSAAPRQGLVSGCYLLDAFYRERPEQEQLRRAKVNTIL